MADLQPFQYLSSQDQIKPEYWESFEPIFTDFEDGQFTRGVGLEKVKRKIEASGYHCIEEGIGHDFEDKSGQYLWDKIKESFAEGGSVIYCRTNLSDGEFVWVKEMKTQFNYLLRCRRQNTMMVNMMIPKTNTEVTTMMFSKKLDWKCEKK